jgi:hypothetical protein
MKGLAGLGMQLGSRVSMARPYVFKAHSRVTKVPARRAGRRHHYDLQDMRTCCYSAMSAQLTTPGHGYSGDVTQQGDTTSLTVFSAAVRWDDSTLLTLHKISLATPSH